MVAFIFYIASGLVFYFRTFTIFNLIWIFVAMIPVLLCATIVKTLNEATDAFCKETEEKIR